MLDGILGRGFSVKCKSLIKATGARIAVVRRRAQAKQKFLNEDLAKLLSNGLDINAYGRTEEFLAVMNLLSCYDFVEQCCEVIRKQLSRMQKKGECPEECREVVASLMYAAARFSDLPELRDLRDIFQQKYGSCLEAFVNQKFVEKLSSRSPEKEKRLQVLQDIASEFSIKWDSKGFERRMAAPSVVSQVDEQKVDIVRQRPGVLEEKIRTKNCVEGKPWRRDELDQQVPRRERVEHRGEYLLKNGRTSLQGDNNDLNSRRHRLTDDRHLYPPTEKFDALLKAERSSNSSREKILDNDAHNRSSSSSTSTCTQRKGQSREALFREKTNLAPICDHLGKTENAILSCQYSNSDSARKTVDEGSDGLRCFPSSALPPPYIKSNHSVTRSPSLKKEDKHKVRVGSKDSCDESNVIYGSGSSHAGSDNHESEEKIVAPAIVKKSVHEKELDYQDELIPLPKPRSIRRKHQKSSSNNYIDDTLEVVKVVSRSSSSRRKDHSRKGLQTWFDEEHHRKDDEERMIDELLIHYSKKQTFDVGKVRKKLIHDGGSSFEQCINMQEVKFKAFPAAARSVSLPQEQASSPEMKVFARSNTFQADNQAKHVHPKLPDYDDLAARFAALKGR